MRPETNRPQVRVGEVPGSLIRHEFAEESCLRLIEYDRMHHMDQVLRAAEDVCSQLELTGYAQRERVVDETIIAAGAPTTDKSKAAQAEKASRAVTWINIDGLADIDLVKALGRKYGLHALALEDVINVNQRAKTDVYDSNIFFVMRMPHSMHPFRTEQVSIFLLEDVVITLQEYPGDCLDPVRERLSGGKGRIRTRGADYLVYAIMDAILDGYFPVLEAYDSLLAEINDDIDDGLPHEVPKRLHAIRADLLNIRKVAQQHENAVAMLVREKSPLIREQTLPFLMDCLDHLKRLIETADTYRETCGELRELYFAQLGQKTNEVMKVLTIIATIFIPMSFIAGIYGMNFDSTASSLNMPELHWAFGYPFAILVMLCTGGGLLFYLRRRGWL